MRSLLLLLGLAVPLAFATVAQADGTGGAAKKDIACLAEAIYFEARGTGAEGEAAVAHVIVNRMNASEFPSTVCGVVTQGCQFSYRCDGRSDALADAKARARAYRIAFRCGTPSRSSRCPSRRTRCGCRGGCSPPSWAAPC